MPMAAKFEAQIDQVFESVARSLGTIFCVCCVVFGTGGLKADLF
jgi:hypothetical protein